MTKALGPFFLETLNRLKTKSSVEARQDLTDLFTHILHIDRLSLILEPEQLIDETLLSDGIDRLAKGEPIAYILGTTSFFGCELKVTPAVLIPRPETELLVAIMLEKLSGKSGVLVDLCTGSGCIGIALKKQLPDFEVILTDISEEALKIAAENAKQNQVDVTILHGDLLAPLQGKKIDILVSNPPYISPEEYLIIDRSVRDFEPKSALVAENGGLSFYQRLSEELPSLMNPGGELFLEIGYTQSPVVSALFSPPNWADTSVTLDLASHPRYIHSRFVHQ